MEMGTVPKTRRRLGLLLRDCDQRAVIAAHSIFANKPHQSAFLERGHKRGSGGAHHGAHHHSCYQQKGNGSFYRKPRHCCASFHRHRSDGDFSAWNVAVLRSVKSRDITAILTVKRMCVVPFTLRFELDIGLRTYFRDKHPILKAEFTREVISNTGEITA